MTPIVAFLTLALALGADAARRAEPVSAVELLPLPVAAATVVPEAFPLERTVVLHAGSSSRPAIATALRATSRLLCPDVAERGGAVVLTCRSTRVLARVVRRGAAAALELEELPGLPARGPEAMPIVFHDPLALGLGGCPGANPAARGECQLRDGDVTAARASFLAALDASKPEQRAHALLRLGDLALSSGDAEEAQRRWAAIDLAPWTGLARARRCELSVPCLVREGEVAPSRDGLPLSMARELALRSARVTAFRGHPLAAAWALVEEFTPSGACGADAPLCRRVLLAALRSTDDASAAEGLAIFATALKPGAGPFARELATAAADVADRLGAPSFAAALLSTASPTVPEPELADHLLRTAELYVAAGDGVRARVIRDFARAHAGATAVASGRWAAVSRSAAALRAAPPATAAAPAASRCTELVEAARALAHARAARADASTTP